MILEVSVMNSFISVCGRNSELVRLDLILLLNSQSLCLLLLDKII